MRCAELFLESGQEARWDLGLVHWPRASPTQWAALLCGPEEALERPGPFVCGEGGDNVAQLLWAVNESWGLKRASQLLGWEGGDNVVPCWI